jgi:hypothetical protein
MTHPSTVHTVLLAVCAQVAAPLFAAPVRPASHEDPLYVLVSRPNLRQGIGRIDGYLGAAPTFTYLLDMPTAPAGHALFAQGIANDPASDDLFVCSHDGYVVSFSIVDLATGTITTTFDDPNLAQMTDFDAADSGLVYGRHLGDQMLYSIDYETTVITPLFSTGGATGASLTVAPDGHVLALDNSQHSTMLRSIELVTGTVTEIGYTYLWTAAGIDLTTDGRLLALTRSGQLFEIDRADASLTYLNFVPGLTPASGSVGIEGVIGMTLIAPQPPGWGSSCSTGTASLFPSGNGLVVLNEFSLLGTGLPPGVPAFVVLSSSTAMPMTSPLYQGAVCVGVPVMRALGTLASASASGTFEADFDLSAFPATSGTVSLQPGDARVFQLWYRDVQATTTSSFSNAVEVTFR